MDENEYGDQHKYMDLEGKGRGLCLELPECDPAWVSSCGGYSLFGLPEMALQPSISSEVELLGSDGDVPDVQRSLEKGKSIHVEREDARSEGDRPHTHQGAVIGYGCSKGQNVGQTKRTRTAEVHNISERRRRDKIKGKMKVLKDLMPHCRKKDRASILEDAANYVIALKLQVEMMLKARESEILAQYMTCMGTSGMQFPSMPQSNSIRLGSGTGAGMGFGAGVCARCSTPCGRWIHLPPASAGVHPFSPTMLAGLPLPALCPTAVPPTDGNRTGETKPCTDLQGHVGTGYIGFC